MEYFVHKDSIVRRIWGKGDTILFIFAGSSAEFALNKAVDWLYFTGRLPADPLGRLFSTIGYARLIVFSELEAANRAIDKMRSIHSAVESNRGSTIPDWAYRDVLFMLIHYSIASFEVLERKLSEEEKADVFDVFYRVGHRMGIPGLPRTFGEWKTMRAAHLENDLVRSDYTDDLFRQYRKHLGSFRYKILLEGQKLVVPRRVRELLQLGKVSLMSPVIPVYKLIRLLKLDWFLKSLILPAKYKSQVKSLDIKK
ncbi:MAG TPA: oxygenase MpaB family protein [Chitinophagaceae bacterium]|nr:oxygenase MpaB family protein [Chitinophagaceae bacterium]